MIQCLSEVAKQNKCTHICISFNITLYSKKMALKKLALLIVMQKYKKTCKNNPCYFLYTRYGFLYLNKFN